MTLLWLLQDAGMTRPTGFWPTTFAGYLALVLSIGAVATLFIGYGKWIEQMNSLRVAIRGELNGFGGRVTTVETGLAKLHGDQDVLHEAVRETLRAQAALLEKIGAASTSAAACDENMAQIGIDIGAKVDEFRRKWEQEERKLSDQLLALRTELRTRKIIGPETREER